MNNRQIAEEHADLHVNLGGIDLPLDQLAGGVLVVGTTGSGKTRSVINPLARAYATVTSDPERKPAIFYFGIKGRGHEEFVAALPIDRQADVIRISGDSLLGINLFPEEYWAASDLAAAVPRYLEEVSAHIGDELSTARHDLYWDRQRLRVLNDLSALRAAGSVGVILGGRAALPLHCEDHLRALLARVDAFLRHTETERPAITEASREEAKKVEEAANDLLDLLEESGTQDHVLQAKHLIKLAVPKAIEQAPDPTVLESFWESIDLESRMRLGVFLNEWYRMPPVTRGCVAADLRGVCESFASGSLGRLLGPVAGECVTLERVIDEGRILVIDLPLAESGGASLPALVAIKLALFRALLARGGTKVQGRPLSRRPVAVVVDECDSILTRGRRGGEDHFLSKCREFGVSLILGTQSLSQILGSLRDPQKVSALVTNCRTKIWGRSLDPFTTSLASLDCGTTRGQAVQMAPVWHGSELFRRFVTSPASEEKCVVSPPEFGSLGTGEFVTTAEGNVWRVDLHTRHVSPIVRQLRGGAQ